MVFLEQRLSKHVNTHTHIQTTDVHPYSGHCRNMHKHKCTHAQSQTHYRQHHISLYSTYTGYRHTHTHSHVHIQLTFIRGLRGPAVQCSSKLWTARIRGSRALIWESKSQRHRAAVTKWRLLSWDASKTTQDFKVWGYFVSHRCLNISIRSFDTLMSRFMGQKWLSVVVSVLVWARDILNQRRHRRNRKRLN